MNTRWMILPACLALALAGCVSAPIMEEDAPVIEPPPPAALFPGYLFIKGSKLNDQGHIPGTALIGGDMTVGQDLGSVRSFVSEQLSAHEWTIGKMEIGRQYFRVLASHAGEEIEIRAVQGTGTTQVFILYQPVPSRDGK